MLRMMPKAEKMLAEMVMKRESPSPKTNLRMSFLNLVSLRGAQPLALNPVNSFSPPRHSSTSTSSKSCRGDNGVVFGFFGVVLLAGVPDLENKRAVTDFSVGLGSGLEVGLGFGRLELVFGVQVVVGDLIHLGDTHFSSQLGNTAKRYKYKIQNTGHTMNNPVSPLEYIIVPPNRLLNECHNLNIRCQNI